MPPRAKKAAVKAEDVELPKEYEELAKAHVATLTAAAFMAPKGVACTLDRLALTVRSLTGRELSACDLRKLVALDDRLALRHAAIPPPGDGQQLELVMRESLKLTVKASAVNSRHKRFRALLAERARTSEGAAPPPLPLAPLPADAPGLAPPRSPARAPVGSLGAAPASTSPAGAGARSPASVSGLPSPPPNPLRRGLAARTSEGASRLDLEEDDRVGEDGGGGGGGAGSSTGEAFGAEEGSSAATSGAADNGSSSAATRNGGDPSSATSRFLEWLVASPFYKQQIVHTHEVEARPAEYTELRHKLAPAVQQILAARGLAKLYCHQAAAVDTLLDGGHVMLCTPTASGKSLGYTVPTLHAMATSAEARALYIFPTKALAQDQLRSLRTLTCAANTALFGLQVDTYDGDTPQPERPRLRESTRIFLTNPDMLHCAVLPHHGEWAHVLSSLKYVVIDETHMYRGVFGAHVALILRRLRRLAALYGSRPSFVCCSATVGNPEELFTQITGIAHPLVVTRDGSPHGRRRLLFWNPPIQQVRLSWCHSAPRRPCHSVTA